MPGQKLANNAPDAGGSKKNGFIQHPPFTDRYLGRTIANKEVQYRIEGLLGAGGKGKVYMAVDQTGRRVAIKFAKAGTTLQDEDGQRFLREAKALKAIKHPNVVRILNFGDASGTIFIAMEWADGKTLSERLTEGPVPWHEAQDILLQACGGIGAAHAQNIIHRDIKPANIMLKMQGDRLRITLLDFGTAKFKDTPTLAQFTVPGTVLGTLHYMAPEQLNSDAQVDYRADIYSLGVVMYEMLTGTRPFSSSSLGQLLPKIMNEKPERLRLRAPALGIPGSLDRIVRKAMEKLPDRRYPDMEAFARDIRRCKWDGKPRHGVRAPVLVAGGLAAALAICAGTFTYLHSRQSSQAQPPAVADTARALPEQQVWEPVVDTPPAAPAAVQNAVRDSAPAALKDTHPTSAVAAEKPGKAAKKKPVSKKPKPAAKKKAVPPPNVPEVAPAPSHVQPPVQKRKTMVETIREKREKRGK